MSPPSEILDASTLVYSGGDEALWKTTNIEVNGKGPKTNGHTNGTNGVNGQQRNGVLHDEFWMPSSLLEQWRCEARDIMERCDLSGLSRQPVKYQLASTGVDGEALSTKQRSIEISGTLLEAIKTTCTKRKISGEAIVLFAVHQMLKGFGNGSHTMTAAFSRQTRHASQKPVWSVSSTIVNHDGRESKYISTAIAEMAGLTHSEDGGRNNIQVVPSDLVRSELLDLMVVFNRTYEATPRMNFPLILDVEMPDSHWKLKMKYAESLFDTMVVDSFLSALRTLMAAATEPTRLLGEIELLPQDQITQMDVWNNTDGEYPSTKRLHHLVEEAAERCASKVALICGEKRITYRELNEQANRLANYICSKLIQPEQLIALFLDKSEMMIETIIGVWKSGAAHVPIDPAYPNERVQFVLDDVKTSYIIASQRHVDRLKKEIIGQRNIEVILLEPLLHRLAEEGQPESAANLTHLALTSKQLAYVTYTSGTTGFPKGIYKEHTSVVNSITDLSSRYGVAGNDDEVILLFSAYVFEPFVRQMLMALTTGNKLAIISDEDKFDPNTLLPYIREHKVTYINGTASVLQEYDFASCPSLKRMILVGENLTDSRYAALRRRFKARILNEYGFTESAFVTALNIFEPGSERLDMSLGRPVRNVKCYILDANLKRVPLGVTGELHIGGLGISRGYMNREELTRKKFLPNPYQTTKEKRSGVNGLLYKTGDLARWLPNGEVEYLGRIDFQIKLRGIRIEPGEIESTLALYPGVRTSIVVSKKLLSFGQETDQEHLVGYFVCDEETLSENNLLSFLEKKLPRYMIPTRLVQLPVIPVTINGKADLRALPTVEVAVPTSGLAKRRDNLDEDLSSIWGDVLGVSPETIGLEQNFFRLGGHSITCIQLIARVRKNIAVGISLEEVFQTRTLQAMADLLRSKVQENRAIMNGNGHNNHELVNGEVASTYLANSLQQGFVYHSLKTQQTDAYTMQSVLSYGISLREHLYQESWEHVQQQHPALRLRFSWETDVMQVIDSKSSIDWRVIDGTKIEDESGLQELLDETKLRDHAEGYRLNESSLIRIYFIRMRGDRSSTIFSCHHSILDGWSLPLLFERVHETYMCLVNGTKPARKQDSAYLEAQKYLQNNRDNHLDFWSKQIDQIEERCDLNALLNEASRYKVPLAEYDQIQEQKQQSIRLPRDAAMAKLLEECSSMGITLHSILQLVWHLVLHAYGGGSHTVTGTTISGRNLPIEGIESSIGLFINTLPLILDHTSYQDMAALDAIAQVQNQVNAMNSRGNVELGRLRKDDLKHGLFDTLFVLENYPNLDNSQREIHEKLLKYNIVGGTEKLSYPLAVIAQEHGGEGCSFTICYAHELFNDDTIEVLLNTVRDTLQNIANNVHAPIRDIEYLSVDQVRQLDKWNATDNEFPSGTLHSLFETEAQQKPNKIAVIYENRKLTYCQLNRRANALAYHLLSQAPVKPNKLVALVIEKSEHLITSILAVWKSGGAYVPIDPSYPDDRIKYILDDTAALAVIADTKYVERLSNILQGEWVPVIPSDMAMNLSPSPKHPVSACTATDLAYVMYTSGTTGRPKGVMVEHHGVVNLAVSLSKIFGLRDTDDEVILSFSNYVFDHFVEQMTDALLNGQTLLILNDDMRGDKERLYRYIETNRVTYLSGTPSVISMYEFRRFKDHLRRIDCVGEAFSEPVFDKIRETFPGLVINGYGPTEVSITTHKRLYPFPERRTDKSIGKQVANSTSYVLNDDMKRVPIGAMGELYLGGDGVARGYHNRPDLTAERFPHNPFQNEQEKREGRNSRLYKTGDLVRWIESADGEVEYLGRNDFQVKIRGQRIELGEIEAVLSSYPEIKQSIVLAKDRASDGQKYLVGYYVSSGSLSPQAIRSYMQTRLPAYMVPARLIPMDKFPVTVSGKLDSKALPVPEDTAEEDVVLPRTEVEMVLARIWAELLEMPVESISVYSDFFSLGGDSLRSTKLSFAATKALGVSVSVSNLFRYPTIEAFARWIASGSADAKNITPLECSELFNIPVSPAQERLLFLHEFEMGGHAYNIPFHQELDANVCLQSLEDAIRDVVDRHEALRTVLVRSQNSSTYCQNILSVAAAQRLFTIHVIQINSEREIGQHMARTAEHVFCLDSELPFMAQLYQTDGGEKRYISFVFHHAAFDAWSWDIFQRDLAEYYGHYSGRRPAPSLPTLRIQYKEYSVEHRETMSSQRYHVLSDFWSNKLSDFEPLSLVTDKPRPAQFDFTGNDVPIIINQDLGLKLQQVARREGVSLYAVMLAAYCYLLNVYTMQTDVSVGIPVSHRGRVEYESVVGFFVNLLPLRVAVTDVNAHDLIATVQKELLDVQIHMDMPFQDIVKLLHEKHDQSRHPLIQTVFNWETETSNSTSADCQPLFKEYHPPFALPSVAKFDLNVTVREMATSELHVNFNYATSLFEEETMHSFLQTYQQLLEGLANGDTQSKLSNFLTATVEPEKVLKQECKMTPPPSLASLFEEQARVNPQRTAVTDGGTSISYADINMQANQLANWLLEKAEIQNDDPIALMLDKSIDMIISILAVWKAGAAYVPLDPEYPASRVSYILQDTKSKILITTTRYMRNIEASRETKVLAIDNKDTLANIEAQSFMNLELVESRPSSLAYIIFTSGTTGKPKGVLVEQQSVSRFREALVARYFGGCNDYQSVLFLSNYIFDFSVEQIVLSILSGNKLVIPPDEGITHEKFYQIANEQQLSYLSGTPSVLQQIQLSRLQHLKMVTAAGEEFHSSQYNSMRMQFSGPINNAYGITETTVYNLVTEFSQEATFTKALRDELPGSKIYILNDQLQPVPINAVGELYLAGGCVTRGYLNQELLTKDRFIGNPFCTSGEFSKLYKTGDLVRNRGHGGLEYLGRRDQQVKLRGFRIELAEVQDALSSVSDVKEATVVVQHDHSGKSTRAVSGLIGYYTLKNGASITSSDIRKILSTKLPSFMIPNKLQFIQGSLPVTVNGKLDVKRLASMEQQQQQPASYTAPRNQLELKLCQLWASILGVHHCGIDDDLFTRGGDSITSLQLVGDIYRQLGRKLTVKDIFVHRTVRAIHNNVLAKQERNGLLPPLQACQGLVEGAAPLLPIQNWFMSKTLEQPGFWNHCFTIHTPELEVERLERAVSMIQQRHDVLRMQVRNQGGKYVQAFPADSTPVSLRFLNLEALSNTGEEMDTILSHWQSEFSIEHGPLFSIGYIHGYKNGSARIWCAFHHLIMDTVSWNIFTSDLQTLYHAADLGLKSSSVKEWALAIQDYMMSSSERTYWEERRDKTAQSMSLLPPNSGSMIRCEEKLSKDETTSLFQQCCPRLGVGMHELLLASVGSALQKLTGNVSSMVTIEGHGREESVDLSLDVSRTIGWFTSMYPFEIPNVDDLIQGAVDVREGVKRVPNHGIGYGPSYGYLQNSLPPISVNYLGRIDQTHNLTGDWFLASGDNEVRPGLYTSSEDKDLSSSMVDITFVAANGQLSVQTSSYWSNTTTNLLMNSVQEALRDIINKVTHQNFSPLNIANTEPEFTPYFSFVDSDRQGSPLFLLPPGEGGAESYFHNIVQGLPNQKLVVFNNHYRHNKSLSKFEDLAEYYLAHIREVQSDGPYHILGWSFGGILAMEIAQRLANNGERIGTLALIDPYFDIPGAARAIGRGGERILDPIYHVYNPGMSKFKAVERLADRIVLFKATVTDGMHGTSEQRELYEWYAKSSMNNLDMFISRDSVELVNLKGTHFTWVHSKEQVRDLCSKLKNGLAHLNGVNGHAERKH